MAATTTFQLADEDVVTPLGYISENTNGDLIYSVTYPQAMSNAQLFVRKNNANFYILASGMADSVANTDGSVTYTYLHAASNYQSGDDVYVRFYSHNPQVGQVFSPGPGDNVWSDAYRVGSGVNPNTPDTTPPSDVTGLTVSDISYNSYKLQWHNASDDSGLAHYNVIIDGVAHTVEGLSYEGSGTPLSHHSVAIVAVDTSDNSSVNAATINFTLPDEPVSPTAEFISKAANGDVVFTVTYPQAMLQAQLFVRKNNSNGYILAAGMGQSVTNSNGSVTYTFNHSASNYSEGDDIYVRFYSHNSQIGQVFSPGPANNVWSDAFKY